MNQRGFLTISLLIFMPLLISTIAVVAGAFFLFKSDSSTRHECRVQLLNVQAEVAEDLKKLLAMNSRAKALRKRRMMAERAVILALEPTTKATAQAALLAVIVQQLTFGANQRALILHAKWLSRTGPESARVKIVRTVRQTSSERSTSNLPITTHTQSGAFNVVASPIGSPTPDYNPSAEFSKSQRMKVRWNAAITKLLPAWFSQALDLEHLQFSGNCSVTLEKEKRKWLPKINRDRFSSNFW
jgi:hypothetical protein